MTDFSKSKITQIKKSLYDIKNPKNLLEFEKSLSKPKKYHVMMIMNTEE